MVLVYSVFTGICLIGMIAGIDMFLYKESMYDVLIRIFIANNSTGKGYGYTFFFLAFLITAIFEIYRYKKTKGN